MNHEGTKDTKEHEEGIEPRRPGEHGGRVLGSIRRSPRIRTLNNVSSAPMPLARLPVITANVCALEACCLCRTLPNTLPPARRGRRGSPLCVSSCSSWLILLRGHLQWLPGPSTRFAPSG